MSVSLPEFVDKTKNHYSTLNCHRSSNEEQISTEYKLLAKKYHPDTATGSTVKFQVKFLPSYYINKLGLINK